MLQPRDHVQLATETISRVGEFREGRAQDFDDNGARDRRLLGCVDSPHPAFADLLKDPILPEDLARNKVHSWAPATAG